MTCWQMFQLHEETLTATLTAYSKVFLSGYLESTTPVCLYEIPTRPTKVDPF